jgi:hypothetical protein
VHLARLHPDVQALLCVAVDAAEAALAQQGEEHRHGQGEDTLTVKRRDRSSRSELGKIFVSVFFNNKQGGSQQPPI